MPAAPHCLQQQQLDAEGDGDADAAQDDYEPAGAAGGDGDGEEQAGGEEDEEGGSQQATQGGSVYEGDFLDGDDDSSSSSSAAHESEGEGDGEGDGSSGGEEEEQHSVFAAGSASGTGMEQRQLIQDWDSSAAGSADSGSELGTEAGALHDGMTAGGDEEGEDDEAGEGEDDDVEYSRSSADGSSGSLRQEGVGDDEWDEDDEPSQHAGGQVGASRGRGAGECAMVVVGQAAAWAAGLTVEAESKMCTTHPHARLATVPCCGSPNLERSLPFPPPGCNPGV